MSALKWHEPGTKTYETGLDRGVLYIDGQAGVPWNGLRAVNEKTTGGEPQAYYFEGIKYLDLVMNEDFSATIEAYSAPYEFGVCDGTKTVARGVYATHQRRKPFGFSYRTFEANEDKGIDYNYKIHLVYNATALPSDNNRQTISNSVDANTKSWSFNTVPVNSSGNKPTSHLIVDASRSDPLRLALLEKHLYGDEGSIPYLPSQDFVIHIMGAPADELIDGGAPDNVDGEVIDGGRP